MRFNMGLASTILIITIIIHSIISPTYYIVDNGKPIHKKYLSQAWFTLKDKDHDYISDNLLNTRNKIVRAIIVFSSRISSYHLKLIQTLDGKIIGGPWRNVLNGVAVEIPHYNLQLLREALLRTDYDLDGYSDLLFIEEDTRMNPDLHYATRQINIRPRIWDLGFKGKYVTVALIDTGIDVDAPGINRSRIIYSYDATLTGIDPLRDELDHGTHVASVIIGENNGSNGNLVLSKGPFTITNTGSQDHITFLLTPIPVYSMGELKVKIYIAPYNNNYTYEAYLYKTIKYENVLDAIKNNDLEYVCSNSSWETKYISDLDGNQYINAETLLSYNITSKDDYGNYVIGLRHNSSNIYLWFNASVPSIISRDKYPISSGVAPEANIAIFRVADDQGNIYLSYVLNALDEISRVKNIYNISVISISLSSTKYSASLEEATKNLAEQGIVIVASTGNYGVREDLNATSIYPAGFPWVISVGAVNGFNNITYYTTIGGYSSIYKVIKPDLLAPGGDYDHTIYTSDSNNEGDTPFYSIIDKNLSIIDIEPSDYESSMGTSISAPIVAGVAAILISILKSTNISPNLSLWDRVVEDYGIGATMLIKEIMESSCYETYPLIRSLNGTLSYDLVRNQYSPSLDHGLKDIHEGFGVLDAYAAVNYTFMLKDYLLYLYGLRNNYTYDYSLNKDNAPLIIYNGDLRNGTIYNATKYFMKNSLLFGNSVAGIPAHFERFILTINGHKFLSRFGVRITSYSNDPLRTDLDAYIYLLNTSGWDPQLLNHTVSTYGVLDKITYITPPPTENMDNHIYYVAVKRATEDSAGGRFRLVIGPGLTAKFVNGSYIWINTTAASPPDTAKYGLIIIYYRNSSGVYLYKHVITTTTNLNGLAHISKYINIINGNYSLQDDWQWYVSIIYTRDPRDTYNITQENIVEGPVYVRVSIGEPVKLYLSGPHMVMDNESFRITATLYLNDTRQPLSNKQILFYESSNRVNWTYIGSSITDMNGSAEIVLAKPMNEIYYYIAVYPGDNMSQYTLTNNILQVRVYGVTALYINVSKTSLYTVEPVNISIKLFLKNSGIPVSGEKIDVWLSSDNGVTWHKIFSGITDKNGFLNYTHIFLSSNEYLLKANYSGSFKHLLFDAESNIVSLSIHRAPTRIEAETNSTNVKVYESAIFTISLNHTCNKIVRPVRNAKVYLEIYNKTRNSWIITNMSTTDSNGYASITYRFTRNGTYIFRARYEGNTTFIGAATNTITIHVKKLNTQFIIINKPISGATEEPIHILAKLVDEKHRPIRKSIVWLEKLVNDTWIKISYNTTDENGIVYLSWIEDKSGIFNYRLLYGGKDYVYNPSIRNFSLTIASTSTKLSLVSSSKEILVNTTFTLAAYLYSNKKSIRQATVYLQKRINNTWITIGKNITDTTGHTIFKIYEPYAGNYTYRAVYYGNLTFSGTISNYVEIRIVPVETFLLLEAPKSAYVKERILVKARLNTLFPFIKPLSQQPVELWINTKGADWSKLAVNYTDQYGIAYFYISFNNSGTYLIKAVYSAPGKNNYRQIYSDTHSDTIILKVLKIQTFLLLFTNTTRAGKHETILLAARLVDYKLLPIVNATIDFYIINNSRLVYIGTAITNSTGYAVLAITYNFSDTTTFISVFNGTNKYQKTLSNYVKVKYIEENINSNNIFDQNNLLLLLLLVILPITIFFYVYIRKKTSKGKDLGNN
ncbi:S8 family serine peptidase [Staphylothermus hellenicus]|uniref:Peptidase S8 and S53 subtilisin kexin sedolisin n=1 Tax=Staphylothermus hellenicus (strain DSM 12710 / JCM 10830 / BK20S6-10-b1 / P8) TaxID=591019 RepID=D7DBF7_STAHD|nr:S8 family serine peptidase [Staphylothermus hellenicus]ADI31504.1 peptidase S8 and S53 subtilisin kexin sedolisin [Staphylothermus hellenicus DSM 12710]